MNPENLSSEHLSKEQTSHVEESGKSYVTALELKGEIDKKFQASQGILTNIKQFGDSYKETPQTRSIKMLDQILNNFHEEYGDISDSLHTLGDTTKDFKARQKSLEHIGQWITEKSKTSGKDKVLNQLIANVELLYGKFSYETKIQDQVNNQLNWHLLNATEHTTPLSEEETKAAPQQFSFDARNVKPTLSLYRGRKKEAAGSKAGTHILEYMWPATPDFLPYDDTVEESGALLENQKLLENIRKGFAQGHSGIEIKNVRIRQYPKQKHSIVEVEITPPARNETIKNGSKEKVISEADKEYKGETGSDHLEKTKSIFDRKETKLPYTTAGGELQVGPLKAPDHVDNAARALKAGHALFPDHINAELKQFVARAIKEKVAGGNHKGAKEILQLVGNANVINEVRELATQGNHFNIDNRLLHGRVDRKTFTENLKGTLLDLMSDPKKLALVEPTGVHTKLVTYLNKVSQSGKYPNGLLQIPLHASFDTSVGDYRGQAIVSFNIDGSPVSFNIDGEGQITNKSEYLTNFEGLINDLALNSSPKIYKTSGRSFANKGVELKSYGYGVDDFRRMNKGGDSYKRIQELYSPNMVRKILNKKVEQGGPLATMLLERMKSGQLGNALTYNLIYSFQVDDMKNAKIGIQIPDGKGGFLPTIEVDYELLKTLDLSFDEERDVVLESTKERSAFSDTQEYMQGLFAQFGDVEFDFSQKDTNHRGQEVHTHYPIRKDLYNIGGERVRAVFLMVKGDNKKAAAKLSEYLQDPENLKKYIASLPPALRCDANYAEVYPISDRLHIRQKNVDIWSPVDFVGVRLHEKPLAKSNAEVINELSEEVKSSLPDTNLYHANNKIKIEGGRYATAMQNAHGPTFSTNGRNYNKGEFIHLIKEDDYREYLGLKTSPNFKDIVTEKDVEKIETQLSDILKSDSFSLDKKEEEKRISQIEEIVFHYKMQLDTKSYSTPEKHIQILEQLQALEKKCGDMIPSLEVTHLKDSVQNLVDLWRANTFDAMLHTYDSLEHGDYLAKYNAIESFIKLGTTPPLPESFVKSHIQEYFGDKQMSNYFSHNFNEIAAQRFGNLIKLDDEVIKKQTSPLTKLQVYTIKLAQGDYFSKEMSADAKSTFEQLATNTTGKDSHLVLSYFTAASLRFQKEEALPERKKELLSYVKPLLEKATTDPTHIMNTLIGLSRGRLQESDFAGITLPEIKPEKEKILGLECQISKNSITISETEDIPKLSEILGMLDDYEFWDPLKNYDMELNKKERKNLLKKTIKEKLLSFSTEKLNQSFQSLKDAINSDPIDYGKYTEEIKNFKRFITLRVSYQLLRIINEKAEIEHPEKLAEQYMLLNKMNGYEIEHKGKGEYTLNKAPAFQQVLKDLVRPEGLHPILKTLLQKHLETFVSDKKNWPEIINYRQDILGKNKESDIPKGTTEKDANTYGASESDIIAWGYLEDILDKKGLDLKSMNMLLPEKEREKIDETTKSISGRIKLENNEIRKSLNLAIPQYKQNSYFGMRVHPIFKTSNLHTGNDYEAPSGAPIEASESGIVVLAEYRGGYGNYIVIDHGYINGQHIRTGYAHCSTFKKNVGDRVSKGETIASVGSTGNSTGPHLHFEVVEVHGNSFTYVDPKKYLGKNLVAGNNVEKQPYIPKQQKRPTINKEKNSINTKIESNITKQQILTDISWKNANNIDSKKLPSLFAQLKKEVEASHIQLHEIKEALIPDTEHALGLFYSDAYTKTIPQRLKVLEGRKDTYAKTSINILKKTAGAKKFQEKYHEVLKQYAATFGKNIEWKKRAYVFKEKTQGSIPNNLETNHQDALDIFFDSATQTEKRDIGPEITAYAPGIVIATGTDWKGGASEETYQSGGLSPYAGNGVVIYNPQSQQYYYYVHLKEVNVTKGDIIPAGTVLGKGGSTGIMANRIGGGNHLHIEIHDYDSVKKTNTVKKPHDISQAIASLK